MKLEDWILIDKIFRHNLKNLTTDTFCGKTEDELLRTWCEIETEIKKIEDDQPHKCPICTDYCDCKDNTVIKCEPPIPKCFHLRVENLTAQEQLRLLDIIFGYAVHELPDNKIINVEIEK